MIRAATRNDLAQLKEIEQEAFRHSAWDVEDFFDHRCFVEDREGVVAGVLVSRQILPAMAGALAEREILSLAVRKEFRRRGVAGLLLQHELQLPAVFFLEVRESNVAARALYLKFGFRDLSYRTGYYENPRETAVVMTTGR